jgi:hypothetical protein
MPKFTRTTIAKVIQPGFAVERIHRAGWTLAGQRAIVSEVLPHLEIFLN